THSPTAHRSKRHGQFETHSPSHEVRSQTDSREIHEARERPEHEEHAQSCYPSCRERPSYAQGREESRTSEGCCSRQSCCASETGEGRGPGESRRTRTRSAARRRYADADARTGRC